MYEVIGVKFKPTGNLYYFNTNNNKLKKGDMIVVETTRGLELGECVTESFEEKKKNLVLPLKKIIRRATKKDFAKYNKNKSEIPCIAKRFKELVKKHDLDISLTDVEYTLNREQLIFYFISDSRVDFRDLVKDLAAEFKTRIELRQIGIRDKAKIKGGIGPCGRVLCCATFLNEFSSVSINMAKNQNLSLSPEKINGVCGRLLCCLRYEDKLYQELRKDLPDLGDVIETEHGEGKVTQLDIIKGTYQVTVPEYGVVTFEAERGKDEENR
ncbi:MAG TPA: stage 0 sporulation family protein [Tenericutes bacterium]|jgi:cell fate regulator YaaT (PSP1 superfamily)|nr:stage 0 sporulation family protein [Mycoplasmatota bacterium]